MQESVLLQQQRRIIAHFRHATQQRTEQERTTEIYFNAERAEADKQLKQKLLVAVVRRIKAFKEQKTQFAPKKTIVEQAFASQCTEVRHQLQRAQRVQVAIEVELKALNLQSYFVLPEPNPIVVSSHEGIINALKDTVVKAEQNLKIVEDNINKVLENRLAVKRKERNRRVGITLFILLIISFFLSQVVQTFLMWLIIALMSLAVVAALIVLAVLGGMYEQQRQSILSDRASTFIRKARLIRKDVEPLYKPLQDRFDMQFVLIATSESDTFLIGETPITNAQFSSFVEAGGYSIPSLWSQDGWAWRKSNKITKPLYWNNTSFNTPKQPVVGVSWYEADAYARWLSQEIRLEVSLPSSKQWLRAAVGDVARTYPWGEQAPTLQFANYKNEVTKKTTPVGTYPIDVSPLGVMDMAGNVSEWTSDLFDSSKTHALKGGSWVGSKNWLKLNTLLRGTNGDETRSSSFGFRIVIEISDVF